MEDLKKMSNADLSKRITTLNNVQNKGREEKEALIRYRRELAKREGYALGMYQTYDMAAPINVYKLRGYCL